MSENNLTMPGVGKIDLDQASPTAASNLGAQSSIIELGEKDTRSRAGLLLEQLKKLIPDYEDILGGASRGVKDLLGGLIPKDVVDRTVSSMAASGISTGTGAMSDFIKNRTAAHLGQTSMDMFNLGMDKFNQLSGIARRDAAVEPMDMKHLMGTPELRAGIQQQNVENEYTAKANAFQFQQAKAANEARLNAERAAARSGMGAFSGMSGMSGLATRRSWNDGGSWGMRYSGSGMGRNLGGGGGGFSGGFQNTVRSQSAVNDPDFAGFSEMNWDQNYTSPPMPYQMQPGYAGAAGNSRVYNPPSMGRPPGSSAVTPWGTETPAGQYGFM
jgi:hypothetical protein